MKNFPKIAISLMGLVALSLVFPFAVLAHPVNEYVQASYLTLTEDQILIDVNLTAGVLIGDAILADIDVDDDGIISDSEQIEYAEMVASELYLEADGQALTITLSDVEYPTITNLKGGEDAIRLHLTAPLPSINVGDYQMVYENNFAPESYDNVYLVNAFVQADVADYIDITDQERDWYQQSMVLSYSILSQLDTINAADEGVD